MSCINTLINDQDDNDCIWFDETGYWRKGDCQFIGTTGSSNTLRISQRDLDCPALQYYQYRNYEALPQEIIRDEIKM